MNINVKVSRRGNKHFMPADSGILNSEFFVGDSGLHSDFAVFARSDNNPELRESMRQYMIEQDVKGFDSSVPDEEVFDKIQDKYQTSNSLLARIKSRIGELRQAEVLDKK